MRAIFCIPCFTASVVPDLENTTTRALLTSHKDETRPDAEEADLAKPTVKEYVGEAARDFFVVIEAVADNIPIPGVKEAVKIAGNLIQACDDSLATLKRAGELKERIKTLVAILVNELKDKKAEEIQEKLKEDVHALEQNLTYIQERLDEIASQHTFLVVFFRSLNEEKVRKCVDRLNNSLENFYLVREINNSNLLGDLENQIRAYYGKLDHVQETVDAIRFDMEQMKFMLQRRFPGASLPGYAVSNGIMPSNTRIFHGREKVVNDLAAFFTQTSRPRVCIMGPGGMGKTSTALAIMAHPDVKKSFPDRNQVWVPCANATSVYLLLETLCLALGIRALGENPFADITEMLAGSFHPLILLLDNFETPWDIDGPQARSQVEEILCAIENIPHIALLVTMRSSSPPSKERIAWHPLDLHAVDCEAAIQIYLDVLGDANKNSHELRDDPALLSLLEMIGHMPLAITLMANVAQLGLSPTELVEKYIQRGTAMLSPSGEDAKHNMDLCISLSVDSIRMKKVPEALNLLATLAMLPGGATFKTLDTLWASDYNDIALALKTLQERSLVIQQDSTFLVLPVIRRYILEPSRFPKNVRESLVDVACGFLARHTFNPRINGSQYVEYLKAISAEETNLQSILLDTTVPTPPLIEALITLARHQEATRPRTKVIEHALKLLGGLESDNLTKLLGLALKCQGDIFHFQDSNDRALASLTQARDLFLSINDRTEVAECNLKMWYILRNTSPDYNSSDHEAIITETQAEFESANDRYGIAICLVEHGELLGDVQALTLAREIFVEFNDLPRVAVTAYQIAALHYLYDDLEQAKLWAETAINQFKDIGRHDARPTYTLGRILIAEGAFDEALSKMGTCLEGKYYGGHHEVADTLVEMGRAWAKMGKKEDAQAAFEESIAYFAKSNANDKYSAEGSTKCKYFIRKLWDPEAAPTEEELYAVKEWYTQSIEELL